ncbi:MAG: DNA replication/repair protein RecF [Gammaproteobacteria bacterium]
MHIETLRAKNVRNLTDIIIEPAPRLNLFIGPNASGKTALLEAIHFLSRTHSFRTPRLNEVIRYNQAVLLVTAAIRYDAADTIKTSIEKCRGRAEIHYNGEVIRKVSEQAKNLPLILIAADTHNLITGAPKRRRHWLDWALFHVEPAYLDAWRDYHQSLRQRNRLLKKGGIDTGQLMVWEQSIARIGEKISRLRRGFLQQLQEAMLRLADSQLSCTPEIRFIQGWPDNEALWQCLKTGREGDREAGYTKQGPHRANVEFFCNDRPVSSTFSRGQIKLYITLLLLAQAQIYEEKMGAKPLILIDDFASELDCRARIRLISMLQETKTQVFLTATESDIDLSNIDHAALFHVEHGDFIKVVE